MQLRRHLSILYLSGIILLSSCNLNNSACLDYAASAVQVKVTNEFGIGIADSVTAVVYDGGFTDTLQNCSGSYNNSGVFVWDEICGPYERPGTYTLIVSSDYFETYVQSGIQVDADECHVITEEIDVVMTRK